VTLTLIVTVELVFEPAFGFTKATFAPGAPTGFGAGVVDVVDGDVVEGAADDFLLLLPHPAATRAAAVRQSSASVLNFTGRPPGMAGRLSPDGRAGERKGATTGARTGGAWHGTIRPSATTRTNEPAASVSPPSVSTMRDYNADERVDWHDYYLEALSPVQTVSIKLGDLLFTPLSALLHTIWFGAWFALGLDINVLTLIVSLEAIYITLFIGLGQKLQDKRAAVQAKAEKAEATKAEAHREQLSESQSKLLTVNTDLTEQVAKLTEDIHQHLGIAGGSKSTP
jgi:hypothetical protein